MPSQFDLNIVVAGAEAYNNTGSIYTDETAAGAKCYGQRYHSFTSGWNRDCAYYFGHAKLFDKLTLNIGTPGAGTGWTIVWEYWNGAWVSSRSY